MKTIISGLVILLSSMQAFATERMYAVGSVIYSDISATDQSVKGAGYKLGLGHQFHPQWYVEAGVQQLADEQDPLDSLQVDGLYLSLLGKARNQKGELFYRIGVMRLDMQGEYVPPGSACATVVPSPCEFNNSIMAGNIGLGFDFFLTDRMMMRVEGEYIQGERDFSAGVFTLGVRYNFN